MLGRLMLDTNKNHSQLAYMGYAPFPLDLRHKSNLHSEFRIQYIRFHNMGLHHCGE